MLLTLQMEKTVDINEGNLFLKDLEMLGTVTSGEQFPSSVGETSPTHTPEGLGFQLGSNPLEQLGLYMKNDDEEDEEGESADEPTIDVEEGEIDWHLIDHFWIHKEVKHDWGGCF